VMSYASQDSSLISQSDLHQTAAHTYSSVSGQTTSLFTHEGGMKVYAANGPVSLQAHTDELQIWADKDVTVISVNDQIGIHAKTKIELMAGQSAIVLEGGNITLTMPGQFTVKGSSHAFLGGGSVAADLRTLPRSTVSPAPSTVLALAQSITSGGPISVIAPVATTALPSMGTPTAAPTLVSPEQLRQDWIEIKLRDDVGRAVPNVPYEIKLPNGIVVKGTLDGDGFARLDGVRPGECEVSFPTIEAGTTKLEDA
jgi:uncharacterized protein (DUF2345 family)